jgi:predicted Zn-ribbon and HTH transcriptional regulator
VSSLSLSVFFVIMFMWVRSDDARDAVRFQWRGAIYALASEHGRVGVDNQPQIDDAIRKESDDLKAFLAQEQKLINGMYAKDYGGLARNEQILRQFATRRRPAPFRQTVRYWPLAAVATVLPAIWVGKFHRRRLRVALGQCAACGYDLRATPERCPECGAVSATKSQQL